MIDLSFSGISRVNKSSSKYFLSFDQYLNWAITRGFRSLGYARPEDDIKYGDLVLTGNWQDRASKREYLKEEEGFCHCCGKQIVYKPYKFVRKSDVICDVCEAKLDKNVSFYSAYGRFETLYDKYDLISSRKPEEMKDNTNGILNFLRSCV